MFYCRKNELAKMNRRYKKEQFECIIVYGRRRIGKTALIREFCKDKPTIFFSALVSTEKENLYMLSKAIHELKNPQNNMAAPEYHSFDDAFTEIGRLAENERLVFVIDEFPYLANAKKSISSMLQHFIDHHWSKGKLYLILCGSSMSFMEHQVLSHESPLYGRRTGQFKIEPLLYRECVEFHKGLTDEDQALVYGITGGVPHYINKLGVEDSVDEALLENLFDSSGYLFEEPGNLLKQELREPAYYNSIIKSIAEGSTKMNEIATKVGIATGLCTRYIQTLIELGIVKKEIPITEKPGKKGIYLLADSFFRFWYRFVPQNMISIASGRMELVYEQAVKQHLHDYMGLIFEKMCQDYLLYYAKDLPIILGQIGQWWGTDPKKKKQIQIDIVGESADQKEYIIGSCKFKNEKIGISELRLMQEYAQVFGKGYKYHYYIFSKGGFTESLLKEAQNGEVHLVTLADMYEKEKE